MAGVSQGAAGEVLAARFLRSKGYEILAANFRTRFGEIDIIAADGQYIALRGGQSSAGRDTLRAA